MRRAQLTATVVAFTLVFAMLGVSAPALGDDAPTWAVAPGSASGPDGRTAFDYNVTAGAQVSDTVAVSNLSAFPVTFLVYPGDAANDTATGAYTVVPTPTDNKDLGAWTTLDQSPAGAACAAPAGAGAAACDAVPAGAVPVLVPARSQALVPFTITVPANASPGDHAGGIVAVYRSQRSSSGQQVTVEQRVGSRIHLRVGGALNAALRVSGAETGATAGGNPFTADATASYTVTNTGNVRVDARLAVSVSGPFGIHLFDVPVDEVTDLVPGQSVTVHTDPVAVFPPGMLFATITASGTVPGGGADLAAVTQTASGWAVSWLGVLLVLLAAAAVAAVALARRRYRRRLAATVALAAEQARTEALAGAGAER